MAQVSSATSSSSVGFTCLFLCDKRLKAASVADLLQSRGWEDPLSIPRLVYDLLFFIVVVVIFLNVIFGMESS